jgi:RNA-directed DNA polymerase
MTEYEQNLEANLQDLCGRVHTGRYRPQPVRRVYIPKADGSQRPLGVPTLEDKIVQGAVAEVLSAIYERCRCSATRTQLSKPGKLCGMQVAGGLR